ncbi:DUF5072 domain-containing protein [Amphibacillus sp. MSJ-3]|uniref:DUF5072 family protein n=1 Tax=Amphibacillus sp. MSJ-3 TaxID=2841505 RepID=UPI001C0EBD00|nr:DUF5072 family protein [Amphibacillus sp. MSJ-3]MBU5594915.1 DUF5072 domain-containing protein [Amphibacillus sp. MSJ-3]
MLKKLSLLDLHAPIQNRIHEGTHLQCLDDIPKDEPAPFCYLEFVGSTPRNTKTMFVHEYLVHVHILSEPGSSVPHYKNIQSVDEALTEYIKLPEGYELWGQTESGLISNYEEPETKERHAVLAFVFKVSYGFKVKI